MAATNSKQALTAKTHKGVRHEDEPQVVEDAAFIVTGSTNDRRFEEMERVEKVRQEAGLMEEKTQFERVRVKEARARSSDQHCFSGVAE